LPVTDVPMGGEPDVKASFHVYLVYQVLALNCSAYYYLSCSLLYTQLMQMFKEIAQ